ncbi:hypothetical protein FD956_03085 [Leuconostoc carnosum]|uniref:DUF7671 family protein n=1 Tax=Leuconostoc carnosum TaxID=1252 RepID=UPI0012389F9F|nr:hypothetical protein [Leuconostoc carnosum]KAA8381283.1 hypothetical protein FD956_03085 [Leuconostoc carnosum]
MADSKKYETHLYTGIVVIPNASGKYEPKVDAKTHVWRTGKHTKGKYQRIGQVFLTENNQAVAVLTVEKLAFNKRHQYTALQRWTNEQVELTLLTNWL